MIKKSLADDGPQQLEVDYSITSRKIHRVGQILILTPPSSSVLSPAGYTDYVPASFAEEEKALE
ncbi:hypothetical protein U1Q18_021022 [Sarracenia purpurea var. burkii]